MEHFELEFGKSVCSKTSAADQDAANYSAQIDLHLDMGQECQFCISVLSLRQFLGTAQQDTT